MTAILKVDTIQDVDGNNIINENSNTITIGASGDTINVPSGATFNINGTAGTGVGISGWSSSSGSLLPASASAGIYLGVNSATAANLLDDYEEGTWTPGCSVASSDVSGTYVKVGNIVTAKFKISIGASGSNVNITGFPFTSNSDGEQQGLAREVETTGKLYFIRMGASGTSGTIIRYDANASVSTADSFQGQITYIST